MSSSSKAVSPSDVLNNLKPNTLQDLFIHHHPEEKDSTVKKKDMVTSIADAIEDAGIKALVATLNLVDLKKVVEKASITIAEGLNKNSKQVLSKKLAEKISESGIDDFLQEHADDALLTTISEDLDLEHSGKKKEDLIHEIGAAVRALGMESFFSSFDVESLHDICEDLKLKTHHSNNKRKLIEAIVKQEDIEKEEPKKKKHKAVKVGKKKDIEKGITYDEVFQHYGVDDVRNWCKSNGLKTSGKKAVLIKRILAFLDGDTENTLATPKGAGKKAGGSGKKAASGKGKKAAGKGKEKEDKKEDSSSSSDKDKKEGDENHDDKKDKK